MVRKSLSHHSIMFNNVVVVHSVYLTFIHVEFFVEIINKVLGKVRTSTLRMYSVAGHLWYSIFQSNPIQSDTYMLCEVINVYVFQEIILPHGHGSGLACSQTCSLKTG